MQLTIGPPKFLKQKLTELKREIDNSTTIVGDFNISLSIMDRTRQINKETEDLNNQLDLRDFNTTLHPTTTVYVVFSSTHETFSMINHMLGHKKKPQ